MKAGDMASVLYRNSYYKCRLIRKEKITGTWVINVFDDRGCFLAEINRPEDHLRLHRTNEARQKFAPEPVAKDLKAENERLSAALKQIGSGLLFFNPDRDMDGGDRLIEEVQAIRNFANETVEGE